MNIILFYLYGILGKNNTQIRGENDESNLHMAFVKFFLILFSLFNFVFNNILKMQFFVFLPPCFFVNRTDPLDLNCHKRKRASKQSGMENK